MENNTQAQRAFIDWMVSLAPAGETPLVVVQRESRAKPGKYTFPAVLPSYKLKPGASVFGNTASYDIARMGDNISASLGNANRVLVLMLDDIGTGSKTPPIAPTWVMETSPGNYQWGYAFKSDAQPDPATFAAAIKAIADAGYTDPGAINAARNFRLPGSVNLKPDRQGFAAILHEFHPDRRFTLPELMGAFGVTAGEASATVKPLNLGDAGADTDEVLTWLSDQGAAFSGPNAEGWAGVLCPNHAQHSDGNLEGRYHPSDRGYKCLHAHCQHITSEMFLEWVGENGGPQVSVGVRSELLSERLKASLDKLSPQANPIVVETEAREKQRVEKADWFNRYAYLESDDAYFDMARRKVVTRAAFNALHAHVMTKNIKTDAHCDAATWFNQNRVALAGVAISALTYAPGEGVLVSHNGEMKGNTWRDGRPQISETEKHSQADVGLWLDLCRTLVPEPEILGHIWDVMAFKVQNPKTKINHAILHMGTEGAGKDTMWAPFLWSVCGPTGENRAIVNGGDLTSQWGYAYESEILILNELHEPEASQRRALANRLKPLIAAPPDTISINRKMLRPYEAANRLFVLAFSNEAVPISISAEDRRWFVVESQSGKLPEARATALWAFYRAGGFEAVAHWLRARDVSRFNPAAVPMATEAKKIMVDNSLSGAEDYLMGLIERRTGEFAKGYVSSRWYALIDRLQGTAPPGLKIHKFALFHALKAAGWIPRGRVHSAELPKKVDVWCAPELADVSKSDLRKLVEPAQVDAGGVVTAFRRA